MTDTNVSGFASSIWVAVSFSTVVYFDGNLSPDQIGGAVLRGVTNAPGPFAVPADDIVQSTPQSISFHFSVDMDLDQWWEISLPSNSPLVRSATGAVLQGKDNWESSVALSSYLGAWVSFFTPAP
jgi:hypothetical protein